MRFKILKGLVVLGIISCASGGKAGDSGPFTVKENGNALIISLDCEGSGKMELRAESGGKIKAEKVRKHGKAGKLLTLRSSTGPIKISGVITGEDIFPASPGSRNAKYRVLRGVSGYSHNRMNTGVYNRKFDWGIEFQAKNLDVKVSKPGKECSIAADGGSLGIVIYERLYQRQNGLPFFKPEEYELPKYVPGGWISWYAYLTELTESDALTMRDWLYEKLGRYGLEYMIIDDGWFTGSKKMMKEVPANVDWTKAQKGRFPNGMKYLADKIHEKGFKAGIWLSPFGCSGKEIEEHPEWFVQKNGKVFKYGGKWHGPSYIDGSNDEAIDKWLLNGVRKQLDNGYDLLKVDGQRHVAYDCYSKCSDFFAKKNMKWEDAYRNAWARIMKEANDKGAFVLQCFGRIPQNMGNPHAIRTHTDKKSSWEKGANPACINIMEYFYENNITWICDPDHICLNKLTDAESRFWCTGVAITGEFLTFSDKIEYITPEKLNILRRIFPVVQNSPIRPLEMYRFRGPRAKIWSLELDRPFERWLVVANMSELEDKNGVDTLDFARLGLDPEKSYTVFNFWKKKYEGVHKGSFKCGLPEKHDVLLYAIREKRDHPWIVSVNRHISQGGISLHDVKWDNGTLSGKADVVGGEGYKLYIDSHNMSVAEIKVSGAEVKHKEENGLLIVELKSGKNASVLWSIKFK